MSEIERLTIAVNRDSVCAGDDIDSHEKKMSVSTSCTILKFLDLVWAEYPLPNISGGHATWLIDVAGSGNTCIGVMAQQWKQPRLLISGQTTIKSLFQHKQQILFFRYWCQSDPDDVYQALLKNMPLPDRYGSD